MKKGFTLVELLAVVIILGILAVVIVPKIQQTIKDSKKNTYEASVRALDREADVFYANQKINQSNFNGCEYNFTTGNNTCEGFEFKGQKPESGSLNISSDGKTSFALVFDDYCYTKAYNTNEITISDYESGTCTINNNGQNPESPDNPSIPTPTPNQLYYANSLGMEDTHEGINVTIECDDSCVDDIMEDIEELSNYIEANGWDNIIAELNYDLYNNLELSYINRIATAPDEAYLINTSLVDDINIILLSPTLQTYAPIIYSVTLDGNSSPVVLQATDIIGHDGYTEVIINISDIDDYEERIFYLFSIY